MRPESDSLTWNKESSRSVRNIETNSVNTQDSLKHPEATQRDSLWALQNAGGIADKLCDFDRSHPVVL